MMQNQATLGKPILFLFTVLITFRCILSENPEESWSFIVLADWHGAETYAVKPGTASKTWKRSLNTIQHIHDNYGGDFVMLPGDSNNGEWDTQEFVDKLDPSLTPQEAVLQAGKNCYGTAKQLFTEGGYDKILMAIGDHEIGGNAWKPDSPKMQNLDSYRQTFTEGFNINPENGDFLFQNPIGTVPSRPIGTDFKNTSYAHQHKNVLFITVDAFTTVGEGNEVFLDRNTGRGGEGVISCSMTGDHLAWFESILIEARKDETIKHIIVQAHVPVLQPVRKVSCSGQFFDLAEESQFWKTMKKYGVDFYFAGEVHANTAQKDIDANSNLMQIIARGNGFNNFLKVVVTDHTIHITAHNEIGDMPRYNNNYEEHGSLTMYKWGEEVFVDSSGALEILDTVSPLIKLTFENTLPLKSRQIIGMDIDNTKLVASKVTIGGITCTESLPNEGSFGQLYDGQIGNVELVQGFKGDYAGSFSSSSRLSIYAVGPHSGGHQISFSLWIKTVHESEMVLVHYGSMYDGSKSSKDIFTLTLRNGTPILYASWKKFLLPSSESLNLNDGQWHHIAVSMPRKSCLLSEVDLFVDGVPINTVAEIDEPLFFVTSGRMSLGGFGYTSEEYEGTNTSPYVGLIDEFQLWSHSIFANDLPEVPEIPLLDNKTFQIRKKRQCVKDGSEKEKSLSPKKCHQKCLVLSNCLGYESSKINGVKKCFLFSQIPQIGSKQLKTKCVQASSS